MATCTFECNMDVSKSGAYLNWGAVVDAHWPNWPAVTTSPFRFVFHFQWRAEALCDVFPDTNILEMHGNALNLPRSGVSPQVECHCYCFLKAIQLPDVFFKEWIRSRWFTDGPGFAAAREAHLFARVRILRCRRSAINSRLAPSGGPRTAWRSHPLASLL